MTSLNLYVPRSEFLDNDRVYPPLSLLYLKSYINETMPDVKVNLIVDYNLDQMPKADYHGISVMKPQKEEANKMLNSIHRQQSGANVICGGAYPKFYPKDCMKEEWDYITIGDGQRCLADILRNHAHRISYDEMTEGVWGVMPRPDRTSKEAKDFLSTYHYKLNGKQATTLLTATGCPMACKFCEEAGTKVRWSPIEKIAMEVDDIKKAGYNAIYLFDDLFAMSINKIKQIGKEFKNRDLIYRCNGHARLFNKEMAEALFDTGCREIAFGHESGSQKILDIVNKKSTIKQNYDSIELAKKAGMKVKSFLMIGLPGETLETIAETEHFIAKSRPDDFQLAVFYPYKGTKFREEIDRGENIGMTISSEGLGAYGQKGGASESVVNTETLGHEELLKLRDIIVNKYKPKAHTNKWNK